MMNRYECSKCKKSVPTKDGLISRWDGKYEQLFHRDDSEELCGPMIRHLGVAVSSKMPPWGDRVRGGSAKKKT